MRTGRVPGGAVGTSAVTWNQAHVKAVPHTVPRRAARWGRVRRWSNGTGSSEVAMVAPTAARGVVIAARSRRSWASSHGWRAMESSAISNGMS